MLMVVLGGHADGEETTNTSTEEIGMRRFSRRTTSGKSQIGQQPRDLTVERAAEMIDGLPSDVPRESALRIVRGTLAAAGIEVSNLDGFTRAQVLELVSEIELARDRQKEFQEKTEETMHALEEEIRRTRKDCDTLLTEEEKKISGALAILKEVRRVRTFFDFPSTDAEENIDPSKQEDTQPLSVVSN